MIASQGKETTQGVEILLVEDNLADVRMMKEALAAGNTAHRLSVVNDGEEAISFLRRAEKFADAPRPDVVLLDLKLPKKDGHAVLREIKGNRDLQSIPVVVLTSSKAHADLAMSYKLNANAFVTKPFGLAELVSALEVIDQLIKPPRSPA